MLIISSPNCHLSERQKGIREGRSLGTYFPSRRGPGPSFSSSAPHTATAGSGAMADDGSSEEEDVDYDPAQDMTAEQVKKAKIDAIWEKMNTKRAAIATEDSARASSSAAGASKAKISAIWEQMNAKSNSVLVQNLSRGTPSGAGGQRKVSEQIAAAAKAAAALVKEGQAETKVPTIPEHDRKESEAAERKAKMVASSSRSLDALIQQISKKPKISVLDKSRNDWGQFKHAEGLADELEAYKKSGDKYLDKVAFLQRADVREYERERDIRLAVQAKRRTDSTCRE